MQTSPFDNIVELMDESYKNYVANNPSVAGNMLVQIAFRYGYRQGFTRAVEITAPKTGAQFGPSPSLTKTDMFGNPEQLKAQAAIAAMSAIVGCQSDIAFLSPDAIDSITQQSVRLASALISKLTFGSKSLPYVDTLDNNVDSSGSQSQNSPENYN